MKKLMLIAGLSLLVTGCKPGTPGHVCLKPGDTVQSVQERFVVRRTRIDGELQRQHTHLIALYAGWHERVRRAYTGLPASNVHYQGELDRMNRQFDGDQERFDRRELALREQLQADWDATTEALDHVQR